MTDATNQNFEYMDAGIDGEEFARQEAVRWKTLSVKEVILINGNSRRLAESITAGNIAKNGWEIDLNLPSFTTAVLLPPKDGEQYRYPVVEVEAGGQADIRISSREGTLEIYAFPVVVNIETRQAGLGAGALVYSAADNR